MEKEYYKDRATLLPLWLSNSDNLYIAAKVTWDSGLFPKDGEHKDMFQYLYRPAALLMGLSLEVLIKGFIVCNDPSLVKLLKEGRFPNDGVLDQHNLVKLFNRAQISIDKNEKECLEQLTAQIEWASKYPIPKEAAKFKTGNLFSNSGHFERFEVLRGKVFSRFDTNPTNPLNKMIKDMGV